MGQNTIISNLQLLVSSTCIFTSAFKLSCCEFQDKSNWFGYFRDELILQWSARFNVLRYFLPFFNNLFIIPTQPINRLNESGKDFNRPQYQILKNALREGDLFDIRVLDMSLLDTTLHKDLLGTFISDLILQVLAYVAQQERDNIKQRQAEGIAIAKAQGKHLGRPKAEFPKEFEVVYREWKDGNITAKKAMAQLELKTTTFYKLIKEFESRE